MLVTFWGGDYYFGEMKLRNLVVGALVCTLVAIACWMLCEQPRANRAIWPPLGRYEVDSTVEAARSERVVAESSPRIAPLSGSSDSMMDKTEIESAQLKRTFYELGKVLEQVESEPDADGSFERITVKKVDAKYPYIRIEERILRDPSTGGEQTLEQAAMVADHILVRLADDMTEAQLTEFVTTHGGSMRRFVPSKPFFIVGLPSYEIEAYDLSLATYSMDEALVTYAEPDFFVHSFALTNDPMFSSQWNLNNIGQVPGVLDADIDALEAWDLEIGDSSLVVGIIDTGVNLQHADLIENLWMNVDEIPDNGIDDDANGYIDDVYGWDFHNGDNDPTDDNGHGTHCAGIVGAVGNNGIGVSGVAQDVSLMALKFLSNQGGGNLSDAVPALYYATDNGAFVTSNSWGGGGYSQAMSEAIEYARQANSIFVAAAGNEAQDTDALPVYPACYPQDNIVSVAATDRYDALASYTNAGSLTVDIAAPGTGIYSTYYGGAYNNSYSSRSGTSMAAPHVAGAAVLLKASDPSLSAEEIIDRMLTTADFKSAFFGKIASSGRLNVNAALRSGTGSYLSHTGSSFIEVNGNGNSVINPGESFDYSIVIKNVGAVMAEGVTATASLLYPDDDIVLLDSVSNVGNVEAGATVDTVFDPFRFSLSESIETPKEFRLLVSVVDADNNQWDFEQVFVVMASTTVSGHVLSLADGHPIVGAKIYFWGDSEGVVDVDASGHYSFEVIDGTYFYHVVAEGFVNSGIIVVDEAYVGGNDIILGRSHLHVSGTEVIEASQMQDAVTIHEIVVTNQGDVPLVYTADIISGACNLGGSIEPLLESWESSLVGFDDYGDQGKQSFVSDRFALTGNNSYYSHFSDESWIGFRHGLYYRPTHKEVESIAVWVRPTLEDPSSGIISLFADKSDYNLSRLLFSYNSSELLHHEEYEGEEWFHLEFRDFHYGAAGAFGNNWCEVYINGEYTGRLSMMPFSKAQLGGITSIYLENERGGSSYWDDIHIEFDDLAWVESSARGKRLTLEPGESSTVRVTIDSTDIDPGNYEMQLRVGSNDPINGPVFIPIQIEVLELPNSSPMSVESTVTLDEDTQQLIELEGSDPDGNPFGAWITEMPARGKLFQVLEGNQRGELIREPGRVSDAGRRVIYLPDVNENGSPYDTLKFQLKDKRSESLEAVVTINVTPINDAPSARNDSVAALPGEVIQSFSVLSNDWDPDGDELLVISHTQPSKGSLIHLGNGNFKYTPNEVFLDGSDSFEYMISDPSGVESTASVVMRYGSIMGGAWPMEGRNSSNDGYYPGSVNGKPFSKLWELDFGSDTSGTVVVGNEQVYVAVREQGNQTIYHKLKTIGVGTGLVEWEYDTAIGGSADGNPTLGNELLYYQRQYYSDRENIVYAVDSASGALVWETILAYSAINATPRIFEGYLYLSNSDNLIALDQMTGEIVFSRQILGYPDEWYSVFGGNELYVFSDGVLYALDPSDGSDLWSLTVSESTYDDGFKLVYNDGGIFINTGAEIIAVDVANKDVRWRVSGNYLYHPNISYNPVVADGVLYKSKSGLEIEAIDVTDGNSLGVFNVQSYDAQNLIVTDDALIASDGGSFTWIFDLETKVLLQTINVGGSLALSNGALIISDSRGSAPAVTCYVLDSDSNTAPVAISDTYIVNEDADGVFQLRGSDATGDPLFATIYSLPDKGRLYQTADGVTVGEEILAVPARVKNSQMQLLYQPPANHFGSPFTSFTFKVNDGTYFSEVGTATISVSNVNDSPSAYDDRIPLREGEVSVRFSPLHNDFDLDGDILTITGYTQPSYGTVVLDGESFIYTSDGSDEYIDTFTYTIKDTSAAEASASISILYNPDDGLAWEMEGTDATRDGFAAVLLGDGLLTEKWATDLGGIGNMPVVLNDRIYVSPEYDNRASFRNSMMSIDRATGGISWRTKLIEDIDPKGFSSPVYANGILLIVGSELGEYSLSALDSSDGQILWKNADLYGDDSILAPVIQDGLIWAGYSTYEPYGVRGAGLLAYDLNTGEKVFHRELTEDWGPNRDWVPILNGEGAVFSCVSNILNKHDAVTGNKIWELDLWDGQEGSWPTATNGKVSASILNARELVVVSLESGAVLWRVTDGFEDDVMPALSEGLIYCVMEDSTVNAYDIQSGVLIRSYGEVSPFSIERQPVVLLDRLIVERRNDVSVFDLQSTDLVQEIPYSGTVAAVEDMLVMACDDGSLRAFRIVDASNSAPVALSSSVQLLEESSVVIQLEASDAEGDELFYAVTELPTLGSLYRINDDGGWGDVITEVPFAVVHADRHIGYRAPLDLTGADADAFRYVVADDDHFSSPAAVTMSIDPVNDSPVARSDTRGTIPGKRIEDLKPLLNDYDSDGDSLRIVSYTQPDSGTVGISATGELYYVPSVGVTNVTTSFEYTITDDLGETDRAVVEIQVSADYGTEWSTLGNGASHAGFIGTLQEAAPFILRWQAEIPGALYSQPHQAVIAEGRVYVTAGKTKKVTAFGLENGALLWSETPGNTDGNVYPLTYYQGSLYLEVYSSEVEYLLQNILVSMNPETGSTTWQVAAPGYNGNFSNFAPCIGGGKIWIFNRAYYGKMYAFDASTGIQRHTIHVGRNIEAWIPSYFEGGVYSFWDDGFHRHDTLTGSLDWTVVDDELSETGYIPATAAISDGFAFFVDGSEDQSNGFSSQLVCLSLNDQTIQWLIDGNFTGSPSIEGGSVYVIEYYRIKSYDYQSGRFEREFIIPGEGSIYDSSRRIGRQPIISNSLLVVSSSDETHVFNRSTGEWIQTIPHGGEVSLQKDALIISGVDGVLYAYSIPDIFFDPIDQTTSAEPISVEIEASVPGGTIYYTLDGSAPDENSRSIANGGNVVVNMSSTINTIVTKEGQSSSAFESSYFINDEGNLIPDWWELDHFGTSGARDVHGDSDGDGRSDYEEWLAGSDPMDRNDYLAQRFDASSMATGDFSINWNSVEDRFYRVKWSDDLSSWSPISSWMQGSGTLMDFTDQVDSIAKPSGFYMIEVQP